MFKAFFNQRVNQKQEKSKQNKEIFNHSHTVFQTYAPGSHKQYRDIKFRESNPVLSSSAVGRCKSRANIKIAIIPVISRRYIENREKKALGTILWGYVNVSKYILYYYFLENLVFSLFTLKKTVNLSVSSKHFCCFYFNNVLVWIN